MSIHIKKIAQLNSFCGIDNVVQNDDFGDYNVIFANNGAGKTSATRAFELLIKNNNHILKYQTISSSIKPKASFLLNDGSTINIEENNPVSSQVFKLEIYNSDFLSLNAPFGVEFGLRKLDEQTIILEGSTVGEETQEIEKLNVEIATAKVSELKIIGEHNNPDRFGEIKNKENDNAKQDEAIDKVRKAITSTQIRIEIDEIKLKDDELSDKTQFDYDEKILFETQKQFDALDEAIKKFDSLSEVKFPILNFNTQKESIETLFNFDMQKEAGEVGEKVKTHIVNVGEQFLKDGRKIINDTNIETCPFCAQEITNDILSEYANYFNETVDKFDKLTAKIIDNLENDKTALGSQKTSVLSGFDSFKPFLEATFDINKNKLILLIDSLGNKIEELKKLISHKNGVEKKDEYGRLSTEITGLLTEIAKIIKLTSDILENKKTQTENRNKFKSELRHLKF